MRKSHQWLGFASRVILTVLGALCFLEGSNIYYGGTSRYVWETLGDTDFFNRYYTTIGLVLQVVGLLLFAINLYRSAQWLVERAAGEKLRAMRELLWETYTPARGPQVVAIGGGTGLSTLLRGIKSATSNITAVVAVTDDGGSSGVLRKEMGILPPGDIRNCLIALAQEERGLAEMLEYRFPEPGALAGHNMGNILMAGLTYKAEGDFAQAVEDLSRVLAVQGRVLPVTLDHVTICGTMADGTVIRGETEMVADEREIANVFLEPADCQPVEAALKAIRQADYIILGPGSLYTSLVSNLLVPGVVDAIRQSQATVYYICNVATQSGEMEMNKASDYVRVIMDYVGKDLIQRIVVNDSAMDDTVCEILSMAHSAPVVCDAQTLWEMGVEVITGAFCSLTDPHCHDEAALSSLFQQEFRRWYEQKRAAVEE